MVRSKNNFPKDGEFVVGKIADIQQQYVYVDLIDYGGLKSEEFARGFIHISEISSRWIRNIRSFVRIGQRTVLRVVRVDTEKGHVDLSLRRVNSAQKKARIKEWKYALKYENLLIFLVDESEITLDEAYEKLGFPLRDRFESYQETIEELKEYGEEILTEISEVSEDDKKKFIRIVNENVRISTVGIGGKLKLTFNNENGIELIKESLIEAKTVIEIPKETRNLSISYIAAPHYRLDIVSKDYLDAENILSEVLDVIELQTKKYNGIFEFIRD